MFFSAAWIGNYKNLPFTASQHSAGYLPVVPSLVCWYLGSLSSDSYDTWSWLQVRISLACTLCLSDSQEIGYYEWASKSYEMVVCGYHIIIYETIHMEFSFCALVLLQPISLTSIDCWVLWDFYGHCFCQACVCCAGSRTAFLLHIEWTSYFLNDCRERLCAQCIPIMLYFVVNGVHDSFAYENTCYHHGSYVNGLCVNRLLGWNICTSGDNFYVHISLNMDCFAFQKIVAISTG